MDFSQLPLFSMLSERMNWLSNRQRVLAENIANVDTPSYQARDLKKQSFDEMVRGASSFEMQRTSGMHLGPAAAGGSTAKYNRQKPVETTLSGNAVTLDTELLKLQENSGDNELVTSLYHKQIAMFRNVLGGGGG